MDQQDPVLKLNAVTGRMLDPLKDLLKATDPVTFDRVFSTVESDIVAWKDAFNAIDKTNVRQMNAAIGIARAVLPMLGRIHQKSVDLGATKGQKMPTAPAAGGRRHKKKKTRRSKKRSSTRRVRRSGY